MANSIFTPCEGAIVKVKLCDDSQSGTGGGGTFTVTINNNPISFPTSGFVLEMQGNYQFLHTLDNFIYYYNFGDRIGEMTVSGFGFMGRTCEPGGLLARESDVCGIFDLYLANRQSKIKRAIPVGTDKCGAFLAFLTGMRLEISSGAAGIPIGQWSLRFHVLPPTRGTP